MYTIARLHEVSGKAVPEGYSYKYDQLNRLVWHRSQVDHTLGSTYAWDDGTGGQRQHFREDVTYDPNGNILTYRRAGANSANMLMDNLTYHYDSDDNRLLYIDDAQTNESAYIGDLEDQASGNYDYDEIGNLIQDVRDSITDIAWTNYQKISAIEKTDRTIRYRYNPMQQRVAKYVRVGDAEKRTYYVRDVQGNVMAAYSAWMNLGAGVTWDSFALSEQHIYGSSRVGYALPGLMLHPTVPANPHALDSCRYVTFEGWKRYEISNHLGNVLAVISDRKHGKAVSGTDIQWFEAEVLSAQQYYPFGMLMPGDTSPEVRRQYALHGYDHRYGFNGKEGDDEVKGDDNVYFAQT